MLAKVKLTMMQRIQLEVQLNTLPKAAIDEQIAAYELRKKIGVPRDLREQYTRVLGADRVILDEGAIRLAEDEEYELEGAELRRLEKLLKEGTFSVPDMEWVMPLRDEVDRARRASGTIAEKPEKKEAKK